MKVQKNCAACGAIIEVRLADHKRGWGKFCDKACAAAHKCGQRPRDVNEYHAKFSFWAESAMKRLAAAGLTKWPIAPSIKDQVGKKVKVKPIYHSPACCWKCGQPKGNDGPGMCLRCDGEEDAMAAMEEGWDGHKVWTE